MSAIQWTEKQTKEIMKKVIRRAEVSRIARLLQHRLALASVKTQNGWENLTLDAIEPKVDENLKRMRQQSSQENTPSPQKLSFNQDNRPSSQASDIGPLPNFTTTRKRVRSAYESNTPPSTKRQRARAYTEGSGYNGRMTQSSPGYYEASEIPHRGQPKVQPAFHSSPPRTPPQQQRRKKFTYHNNQQPSFHSSPPKTPPRRMKEGADLLLYLATSPSPAHAAMPRTAIRHIPSTPPYRGHALPSSMMAATPGCPQTPQTGFNFADFLNITPSPAQAAFGSVGRGTPIAKAQKRLNFDQPVPPSGSPPNRNAGHGLGVPISSNIVS